MHIASPYYNYSQLSFPTNDLPPFWSFVLDLGANEPMIHQRLVDKFKYAVNPNGRRITGIDGESLMMARTIEPLEVTLFPDDCDREAQAAKHQTP